MNKGEGCPNETKIHAQVMVAFLHQRFCPWWLCGVISCGSSKKRKQKGFVFG
ncbi:hypothetical protein B4113_1691 [Geobacillus sp. B4113_201601]|nr:hypothetical protein B4113_1691 [Geobacillus sp. B4113_201601]